MVERQANDDMVEGYRDGYDLECPPPNANRSQSYRHGFENGRREKEKRPGPGYVTLCEAADRAMEADERA